MESEELIELMKKVEEDTRLPRRSAYKPYEVR